MFMRNQSIFFWSLFSLMFLWGCNSVTSDPNTSDNITPVLQVDRLEPPHWWVGMEQSEIQLLVKSDSISKYVPSINHRGIELVDYHLGQSPNYLFLDIKINTTTSERFDVMLTNNSEQFKLSYELKSREQSQTYYKGFDSSDAIYLITPDRFANGDASNDVINTLKETELDRSKTYSRHGGDIKGIINHLDYIKAMGFTAIWSSPLLTNDMYRWSYHGYAMTDFYEVDPRFGSLDDYKKLSREARSRGIKLIMDQVANHCGLEHWWMKDLPFKDWVNYQKEFEAGDATIYSSHQRTTNQDLYATEADKKLMSDGWFVDTMPDLNQRNPFMAKYLIQNSIWWVETLGLSGIRQDTYPYPDKHFMANWAKAIMTEYPDFTIVGEEWSYNPNLIAYWQQGNTNQDGYESHLKSTMDFAMQEKIVQGIKEEENWGRGLTKLYTGLANDFIYPSPKDIMLFLDNHDMSRVYTQFDGDLVNTKMALGYMLALPRIPQIYYGTEIVMDDFELPGDHGLIRSDFPGGWEGDEVNAVSGEGLTARQAEMQNYLKQKLNYRKDSKAIHQGVTKHFAPKEKVYVLFRSFEDEVLAVIVNKNKTPYELDLLRFKEMQLEGKMYKDIESGKTNSWGQTLTLEHPGTYWLSFKNNE